MRTARRSATAVILAVVIVLALLIALAVDLLHKEPVDPHEGQVYINDGFDMVWITPLEGVDVNDLDRAELRLVNGVPQYTGSSYRTLRGVDVSEHQWGVDWQKVAASGVDYAMIRIGYRGYTEGGLFEDPHYRNNIEGVLTAGMDAGVYFFSQAVTAAEAVEEAEYVIGLLEGYEVTMPVVFDWEHIESADGAAARTDGLDGVTLTDCALAFCQTVTNAGYDAGVYFNRHFGYYEYDLSRLTAYTFWLAQPGEYPDFYYKSEMWQYSFTSTVPGIEGETDMNLFFIPVATAAPSPAAGQ